MGVVDEALSLISQNINDYRRKHLIDLFIRSLLGSNAVKRLELLGKFLFYLFHKRVGFLVSHI